MDNNTQPPTQTPPPTAASTADVSTLPINPSAPPIQPQPKSRFGLLFGILIVLGIIFLGGTYYMVTTQKTSSPTPIINKEVETQADIHKLDEQLQSIEQQSIESDFTEVDQELKNL